MEHPTTGFGLCHARNLGLEAATGDIIAYLDDDNSLHPDFVKETLKFFQQQPEIKCGMVQQNRRRDVVKNGQITKSSKAFTSPSSNAAPLALLNHLELFDSNGFAHYRDEARQWNPKYQVFADYEYFLQCLSLWGLSSFQLNPLVLVNYIQSSNGAIGKSNYYAWAMELQAIYDNRQQYSVLQQVDGQFLSDLALMYKCKYNQGMRIPAFNQK